METPEIKFNNIKNSLNKKIEKLFKIFKEKVNIIIAASIIPISSYAEVNKIKPGNNNYFWNIKVTNRISGESWICNFSKLNYNWKTYNVTAKHCIEISEKLSGKDIYISNKLSNNKIKVKSSDKPKHFKNISFYSDKEIIGKNLTIQWCIPSKNNKSYCYEIIWEVIDKIDWIVFIIVEKSQIDKTINKTDLRGLSWAPVLDDQWNLYWVATWTIEESIKTKLLGLLDVFLIAITKIDKSDIK